MSPAAPRKAAAKKATAKKATARKATAKKVTARKATARKATAPPPAAPPPPVTATAPPPPASWGPGVPPRGGPPAPPPAQVAWGQPAAAAPPPNARKKPGYIVAATVGIVALVGGAFTLYNVTKSDPKPAAVVDVVNPTGLDPDGGLSPAPPPADVPLPGPQPEPAPAPDPAPEPEPTPDPGGSSYDVAGLVNFTAAAGWQEGNVGDDFVYVYHPDGADFRVTALGGVAGLTADQAASLFVDEVLSGEVSELAVVDYQDVPPATGAIVASVVIYFEGVMATSQGSAPVEGLVLALVTQDGNAVIVDTLNATGAFSNFQADYEAMIGSVLEGV